MDNPPSSEARPIRYEPGLTSRGPEGHRRPFIRAGAAGQDQHGANPRLRPARRRNPPPEGIEQHPGTATWIQQGGVANMLVIVTDATGPGCRKG